MDQEISVLAIDLSTQSLKVFVSPQTFLTVNFESDLPNYATHNGVYYSEGGVVTSNLYMFVEALDVILNKLKDIHRIKAISFAAQQHGAVYWRQGAQEIISNLDPKKCILPQLQDSNAFTISQPAIWMDSSTTKICKEFELTYPNVAQITGSKAFERFTGSQIAKIVRESPEVFDETEHISLLSSFLPTLFAGRYVPIDIGDGSGMNMMDIHTREWDAGCLDFISQGQVDQLMDKLGSQPCPTQTVLGTISKYFIDRYGFPSECLILAGTGDNPSTLIGLGLKSQLAISLGTSDTLLARVKTVKSPKNSHIFAMDDGFMAMVCTKNGSLVREKYRKLYCKTDSWDEFGQMIQAAEPATDCGVFIDQPEITPPMNQANFMECESDMPARVLRSLIESKMASLKLSARDLGIESRSVVVTGGGSNNHDILQIIADVFDADVYRVSQASAACVLGAAIRAFKALGILFEPEQLLVCQPQSHLRERYKHFVDRYESFEKQIRAKYTY